MKRSSLVALALTAAALLVTSGCSEPEDPSEPKPSPAATTQSQASEQNPVKEQSQEQTVAPVEAEEPEDSPTQNEDVEPANQDDPSSTDELSEDDLHPLRVLALTSVLEDNAQKDEMCDAWKTMGDEATAAVINSEVDDPDDRFPVEVVAEVFENSCT